MCFLKRTYGYVLLQPLIYRHYFICQNAKKRSAKPQISNTLICWDGKKPHIMNETRGWKVLRRIEKSLILLSFLFLVSIATDQKVGGSNPSGRATKSRNRVAVPWFCITSCCSYPRICEANSKRSVAKEWQQMKKLAAQGLRIPQGAPNREAPQNGAFLFGIFL